MLVLLTGCGQPSLPKGAVYESVPGDERVAVQSSAKLDVLEDGKTLQADYNIDNEGNIRIVISLLGLQVVQHYRRPLYRLARLADEDGSVTERLYDPKHLPAARREYYCSLVEQKFRAS